MSVSGHRLTLSPVRLFRNAKVFSSVEGDDALHESLVIQGDEVVFVGSEKAARAEAASLGSVTAIDLNGQILLPGIIDAHTHLVMTGGSLSKVNCLGKDIKGVQTSLKSRLDENPSANIVQGCQFQYDALGVAPHRKYLDEAILDTPVIVESSCYHSAWLNSAAIVAVGVTKETPDPIGGEIVRDAKGEPTGWFKETAVMEHVWPYVARQTSIPQRVELLDKVFKAYLSVGVTGAVDLATTDEDIEALEMYSQQHGRLPICVACHYLLQPKGDDDSRAAQVHAAVAHRQRLTKYAPWLSVAGVKIVSDGVVDSCTAFLKEPYANGATPGPIWPGPELNKVVTLADSFDLQVAVHAIGDAASEQALDAFEAAIEANGPRESRRHRIEHLEVVSKESISRLTRLGVVASLQPVHADPVKVVNWQAQLGHDHRCDRMFPWSEFVQAKSKVAFGSDAPTAPYHPMPGLYTATTHKSGIDPTRADPTDARELALRNLCISLQDSIRFHTAGSAYSMRSTTTGSLAPGMSADFCVIDIDPFQSLESLRDAQRCVTETWVAGEKVFSKV